MDAELWARAIAAGIPDAVFWRLTPLELSHVFAVRREQARAATLRAALIAAQIINVNLRAGATPVRPEDFLREPRRASDYMSVRDARRVLAQFATRRDGALPA